MHGGLWATFYQDQPRQYSYPRWYKRSITKEKVSRNLQRYRRFSFDIEIWHFHISVSNLTTRQWSVQQKDVRSKSVIENFMSREKHQQFWSWEYYYYTLSKWLKLHLCLKGNKFLTLFRMEKGGKVLPTSFFSVISTSIGISPQNFLTFSFSGFCYTSVKLRPYLVPIPN